MTHSDNRIKNSFQSIVKDLVVMGVYRSGLKKAQETAMDYVDEAKNAVKRIIMSLIVIIISIPFIFVCLFFIILALFFLFSSLSSYVVSALLAGAISLLIGLVFLVIAVFVLSKK